MYTFRQYCKQVNEAFGVSADELDRLRAEWMGKEIRIVKMDDEYSGKKYEGRTGVVESVDDIGQLHGTWGGLALIPGVDEFVAI